MTGQFQVVDPGSDALALADDDLEEAVGQLRAALLVGPDQEQHRAQALAFAADHPDCLHRSCLTGHFTGSALVIDPSRAETLLIDHVKLGRWLQPGGHADGDGNLGAVAWREATEETGLEGLRLVTPAVDLDIHPIPARADEPAHVHLDLRFLVLAGAGRDPVPNHEILGARWQPVERVEAAMGSELRRAVGRAFDVARRIDG
jgi:8-oxo-dGTP pyrophosphatase MutT (NUDIX family)